MHMAVCSIQDNFVHLLEGKHGYRTQGYIDGHCWQVAFTHTRACSHYFLLNGMFGPLDLDLAT